MPRMRAPYTGVVFDVHPANVEKRLARGFALLEPYDEPEPAEIEQGPSETDFEQAVGEPEQDQAEGEKPEDQPAPSADSTVPEIRAWAEEHGIELPKKANKAALLAAIEGA